MSATIYATALLLLAAGCATRDKERPLEADGEGEVIWSFRLYETGTFYAQQRIFFSKDPTTSRVVSATVSGRPKTAPGAAGDPASSARSDLDPCSWRYAVAFAGEVALVQLWDETPSQAEKDALRVRVPRTGSSCGVSEFKVPHPAHLKGAAGTACRDVADEEWCTSVATAALEMDYLKFELRDRWDLCASAALCGPPEPSGAAVEYEEQVRILPGDAGRLAATVRAGATERRAFARSAPGRSGDLVVGGLVTVLCAQSHVHKAGPTEYELPAKAWDDNFSSLVRLGEDDSLTLLESPGELEQILVERGVDGWRCDEEE